MILVDTLTYDRCTSVLTARYRALSAPRWAAYQYRGVSPDEYERVRAAGPRRAITMAKEIAPAHAWRRVGAEAWSAPGAADQPGPVEVLSGVAPRPRVAPRR